MTEIFVKIKNLNWFYFFTVSFLSFVGVVMIYSATSAMENNIFINHLTKVFLGLAAMTLVSLIEIDFWKKNAFYLYIFFLFLLIWASFYGHIGKGSRRWIEFLGFYPDIIKYYIKPNF